MLTRRSLLQLRLQSPGKCLISSLLQRLAYSHQRLLVELVNNLPGAHRPPQTARAPALDPAAILRHRLVSLSQTRPGTLRLLTRLARKKFAGQKGQYLQHSSVFCHPGQILLGGPRPFFVRPAGDAKAGRHTKLEKLPCWRCGALGCTEAIGTDISELSCDSRAGDLCNQLPLPSPPCFDCKYCIKFVSLLAGSGDQELLTTCSCLISQSALGTALLNWRAITPSENSLSGKALTLDVRT